MFSQTPAFFDLIHTPPLDPPLVPLPSYIYSSYASALSIFSYTSYLIGGGIEPAMVLDLKLTPPSIFHSTCHGTCSIQQLYTNSIDIHVADCMQII